MKTEIQEIVTRLDQQSNKGEGGESMKWLFRPLLQMLAGGESVTIEDMATTTGKPVEEVKKVLQSLPSVEIDEQGRVVGLGLTLIPTPHHFTVDGKQLYAWCALDTLIFPSTHRSFGQHRVTLSQHRRTYTVECGTGPHCKRGTFHCRCLNRDAR